MKIDVYAAANPGRGLRMGLLALLAALAAVAALASAPARADETCQSPYLPKIIGQEDDDVGLSGGM